MATELTVVNDCLAIMGEAPLNTLAEDHSYKAAALSTLARVARTIQSRSWWFNMESMTLTANPVDFRVYLPNDVGTILPSHTNANLTQRGRVMYDLSRGTDRFDAGFQCAVRFTRQLALGDVPDSVASLIVAKTVAEFQSLYDGDQTKTRNLLAEVELLQVLAYAEHIRNRRVNLVESSERLHRVRRVINHR